MTRLPPSATDVRVSLAGLAGLVAMTAATLRLGWRPEVAAVALMAATALPILALDVLVHRVHRRPSTGLDWSSRRPLDARRIATRWLGAAAAMALPLAVYALAPEYRGAFYDHFYWFLRTFAPPMAALGFAWLALADRLLVDPRDGFWHLGAALTRQGADRAQVANVLRTWTIKGFFFPLMFTYAVGNVIDLQDDVGRGFPDFFRVFDALWTFGFLVDLVFTCSGYLLTLRAADTHVRSAEPTAFGWAIALACYQPFLSLFSGMYVHYDDGRSWADMLAGWPHLKMAWGVALLALLSVYVSATVSFGCRFSNLTHRGIVTGGPYALTKHPAYVAKCAFWWLQLVPFWYRGDPYEVLRGCVWLAVFNAVYFLRARTEERHLSRDPAYVAYALAMNERSIFARVGRAFPALRYAPPPTDLEAR